MSQVSEAEFAVLLRPLVTIKNIQQKIIMQLQIQITAADRLKHTYLYFSTFALTRLRPSSHGAGQAYAGLYFCDLIYKRLKLYSFSHKRHTQFGFVH